MATSQATEQSNMGEGKQASGLYLMTSAAVLLAPISGGFKFTPTTDIDSKFEAGLELVTIPLDNDFILPETIKLTDMLDFTEPIDGNPGAAPCHEVTAQPGWGIYLVPIDLAEDVPNPATWLDSVFLHDLELDDDESDDDDDDDDEVRYWI